MANRPSVPEIITVNSETLQAQVRDLLPSQNGFGSELQASNVITPIIDLTSAAEGSGLSINLQTAIAFGSQTAFAVSNGNSVLANSPGFYRIVGSVSTRSTTDPCQGTITMTDGSTTKIVFGLDMEGHNADAFVAFPFDLVVFLRAGDSVSAVSNQAAVKLIGSTRQIATGDGTLVQPNGYPL